MSRLGGDPKESFTCERASPLEFKYRAVVALPTNPGLMADPNMV